MERTRRHFLSATAGAITVGAISQVSTEPAAAQRTANIYLGGTTANWIGRDPSGIAEEENPTLTLREGATYRLAWENMDGAPHNILIEDSEENKLHESPLMSDTGKIQVTEFTATSEMDVYYCVVHPGGMQGDIEIVPADSDEGISPDNEIELPEAQQETETETEETTEQSEGGKETTESADAGREGTTKESDDGDDDSAGNSGPGFGILAAAAGIVSAGLGLARHRSE